MKKSRHANLILCRNRCRQWENMVNFIPGIPMYAVGDLCVICRVWFPKDTILFCGCCGRRLRKASRHKNSDKVYKGLTEEKIKEIIKKKIEGGWKPVKTPPPL